MRYILSLTFVMASFNDFRNNINVYGFTYSQETIIYTQTRFRQKRLTSPSFIFSVYFHKILNVLSNFLRIISSDQKIEYLHM